MHFELMPGDTEEDITERGVVEELDEVLAQPALRHLDRSAVRLTGNVDRVANHADLHKNSTPDW